MTATIKLLQDLRKRLQNLRTHICSSHLEALGRKLDLLTKSLSYEILLGRVNTTYDYRFQLGILRLGLGMLSSILESTLMDQSLHFVRRT